MTQSIGILGSDSSHCEIFPAMINMPDHPDHITDSGARVAAIWGEDPHHTAEVASKAGIESAMSSPQDVVAASDLVFVMTRHGGLHLELARLAAKAGKPVFIDKPLTATPSDALALVSKAREAGVTMVSFSTLRYGSDVLRFGREFSTAGPVRYASYTGPASRISPYGGIIFYAIHCVELMLFHHGANVASVQAIQHPVAAESANITVTCTYEDGTLVTLGLIGDGAYQFRMLAYGRDAVVEAPIVARDYYKHGVQEVLAVLRGDKPSDVTDAQMVRAVQVCEAIELSLQSGGSVDPRALD